MEVGKFGRPAFQFPFLFQVISIIGMHNKNHLKETIVVKDAARRDCPQDESWNSRASRAAENQSFVRLFGE
jgi:hypothetical protein